MPRTSGTDESVPQTVPYKEILSMRMSRLFALTAFVAALCLSHLQTAAAQEKIDESVIKANLAKLSPEDRKLAEEQKWCAIENDSLLGAMGTPVKVMIKDQPVFLCCKSCVKSAKKDPDKTLEKVKELKAKAAAEKNEKK
jgi:hypothetical protein